MDNPNFNLNDEIESYAKHITHDIKPAKKQTLIKAEYIAHLEDSIYRYILKGMDEKSAFEKACSELGDISKIQRMLTIAHKRDRFATILLPLIYIVCLNIALLPIYLSNCKLDYTTEQWITIISFFTAVGLIFSILRKSYKYVRALLKRKSLIKRIKRICKDKALYLKYGSKYYTSIFGKSSAPEVTIISSEKIYKIKMFACLRKKDIYTLTSPNSFFTTNNVNPIFVEYHYPTMAITKSRDSKLYLSPFYKSQNTYVRDVKITPEIKEESGQVPSTVNILCINPIAAKMEVVRTNRSEEVFDGEEFKGYTVYSGNALCELLKALYH